MHWGTMYNGSIRGTCDDCGYYEAVQRRAPSERDDAPIHKAGELVEMNKQAAALAEAEARLATGERQRARAEAKRQPRPPLTDAQRAILEQGRAGANMKHRTRAQEDAISFLPLIPNEWTMRTVVAMQAGLPGSTWRHRESLLERLGLVETRKMRSGPLWWVEIRRKGEG
jgi:hypothetical protein